MSEHHRFTRTNGVSAAELSAGEERSMADLGAELTELAQKLPGSLSSLYVRSGNREIQVKWERTTPPAAAVGAPAGPAALPAEVVGPGEPESVTVRVRSPLVGTYYAAPAPDAPPFVSVGDVVEHGQTVAIVEAMKMMNPVLAEQPGVVVEVLAENGTAVEFDQPLIALVPAEPDVAGGAA